MIAKRIGGAAALALLAALAACGGPMRVYTRGVKPLNENERKESTPVDVRLYQLKDDSRFKQATVDKLWTDEKTALADDLLERKVITVQPATADDPAVEHEWPLHTAARFIGMLALYPQETDKGPRKLIVSTDDAHRSIFRFTGYHVLKEP